MFQTYDIRNECKCPPLPSLDPREKTKILEKSVENIVTARQARANFSSVTKVAQMNKMGALGRLTDIDVDTSGALLTKLEKEQSNEESSKETKLNDKNNQKEVNKTVQITDETTKCESS